MTQDRKEWVDAVKGFGIILIVIGHIATGLVSDFIYLFHVPLFFFLSGYLFKGGTSFKPYVIKKIWSLLVPYFSFLLCLLCLVLLKDYVLTNSLNINLISNALVGGQALTGEFSAFWFVTSLFLTQIVFSLLIRVAKERLLALVMLSSLLTAYFSAPIFESQTYFWSMNTLLYTLPIYYLGFIYKALNKRHILLLAICYVLPLLVLFNLSPGYFIVDIKNGIYGTPVMSFFLSIAMCFILIDVVKIAQRYTSLIKGLALVGGMSMTIMYLHQPVQIVLKHGLHIESVLTLIATTLCLCFVAHNILQPTAIGRKYFLGHTS